LYELIVNGLSALREADGSTAKLVETLFVFRLLAHLGYAPDPSASNLSRFADSQSYQPEQLSDFQAVHGQAVEQINQALHSTQL
jgi:recombinational DNA repair protein (RecF pathway)